MLKMHFHLSRTHWPTFQPFPQYVPHYPRSIRDPPTHCSFSPGFLIPPKPLFLSRYCSYLCIFLPPFSDQLYHDYSFWRRGRGGDRQARESISLASYGDSSSRTEIGRRNRHQLGEFYRVRHFEAKTSREARHQSESKRRVLRDTSERIQAALGLIYSHFCTSISMTRPFQTVE